MQTRINLTRHAYIVWDDETLDCICDQDFGHSPACTALWLELHPEEWDDTLAVTR